MTSRRRIAALLDRLSSWVFGPSREAWAAVSQASIDEMIERGARE